jgi:hypothetical protein
MIFGTTSDLAEVCAPSTAGKIIEHSACSPTLFFGTVMNCRIKPIKMDETTTAINLISKHLTSVILTSEDIDGTLSD